MKNNLIFTLFFLFFGCVITYTQSENYARYYNKGEKDKDFEKAEKNFRIAIDDSLADIRAIYNLSNKYYNNGLYDEAINSQIESIDLAKNKNEKHQSYYNLGNSFMKKEMCSEAVLAYKNALRNKPDDDEARYNLALAKKCEDDQQNNDKDDENNDKDDENNDKDDENRDKDDENKDKDDENKDKDDENNDKDDENKDKDDENNDKDDENKDKDDDKNTSDKPKEKSNQEPKLSSQQINNLLKAMEKAEKKVQAKVNENKEKGPKVVTEKDW